MGKILIGGVLQYAHLSALCILGIADRPGIAAAVLSHLAEQAINVQFICQLIDMEQRDHLCLCIDRSDLCRARPLAEAAGRSVGAQSAQIIEEVSIVSIFGPDFRERPGISSVMFVALAARDINILAISSSISTVSCVIEAKHLAIATEALEDMFALP